jgi:DNA invertase Pin-like site-specific DNA recombinase
MSVVRGERTCQLRQIVDEFYDAAVSGSDAIEDRPGFAALLDRIENNGVRTVIVEDVSRFAREMKAHVLGLALLRERGVQLLSAVDGQNLTEETDEMTEGMVTIMAVFAQIERKRLVKKLKAARDRKSLEQGRQVEGRKSYTKSTRRWCAKQSVFAMETAKNIYRFVMFPPD